ncbi:MAG: hypothetical protein WKF66_14260 [Pedobacter sp.]
MHQGYLIRVDQKKSIRGAYDGTLENDVSKLINDMVVLLQEKGQ